MMVMYSEVSIDVKSEDPKTTYLQKMEYNCFIRFNNIDIAPLDDNNISKDEDIKEIYSYFSEEELNLLLRVVQAEIGIGTFENKCNVVSVIFNRLALEETSLTEVLMKEGQFKVVTNSSYLSVTVDETTILACEYVFSKGVTNDAIWFNTNGLDSWASKNRNFIMKDEYHSFYN